MASETFKKPSGKAADWFQICSKSMEAPRWSINQAKDKFSHVVRLAQKGAIQIVEDQRARNVEPVVVISLQQLITLLEPPEVRLADLFRPTENQARAERLVIHSQKKKTARIQL